MIIGRGEIPVLVATRPVDFRKQMDGLAAIVKEALGADPFSGAIYVFRSKRNDRLKLLWWDHNGFAVLYKRLHRAMTQAPKLADPSLRAIEIDEKGLGALLRGVPRPPRPGRENALDADAGTSRKGV